MMIRRNSRSARCPEPDRDLDRYWTYLNVVGQAYFSAADSTPRQVVKARLDGAHPLKAWREYRGITQTELASRSGVARDLIVQIETHKKQGSVTTLDRLARALTIPIEALIAEPR